MNKFTDEELDSLSDEERAALEDDEDTEGAAAAKESDEDDDAEDAPAEDAKAAAASADNAPDETADDADSEEDGEEEPAEADAPEPVVPLLSGPEAAGFDEQIAALEAQRKDVRAQYRAGDLDADAYDATLDDIARKISAIEGDRREAALTERFNRDIETARYVSILNSFKAQVKDAQGVDYDGNPKLLDLFDAEIKALANDETNEDKSYDWFLKTAHQRVLDEQARIAESLGFVRSGKPAPSTAATRNAIAARRPSAPAVGSLATVPSADGEQPGTTEFAHLDGLGGDDLESAVARMTPEQQDRWARA